MIWSFETVDYQFINKYKVLVKNKMSPPDTEHRNMAS